VFEDSRKSTIVVFPDGVLMFLMRSTDREVDGAIEQDCIAIAFLKILHETKSLLSKILKENLEAIIHIGH